MSKQRSVLGKGLSALIPGAGLSEDTTELNVPPANNYQRREERQESPDTGSVAMIEIARVSPNKQQPRKEFPKEALDELTQSIKEHGVIQAITVRKVADDRYELVSGERRVRAAIEAGLTTIPAYILDVTTDRKMLEMAIIENVQRLQFNPVEEAEAYERLISECGLSQEEVADKIGKDRTTVSNFLRLLRLPEEIRESIRHGNLGMGHAKAIMTIPDPERQVRIWNEAVRENWSVRRIEDLARTAQRETTPTNGVKRSGRPIKKAEDEGAPVPSLAGAENEIKQIFHTQVKVRMKADETGDISIQFYSRDDLERITELLLTIKPQ